MAKNKINGTSMKNLSDELLTKYRKFLESIPLSGYREELKDIKWVEQDLPKEMLPLESIFKYYWFEKRFLNFDEWFEISWKELNTNSEKEEALRKFKKYYFDKDGNGWFKKGFRARMYRTWVSVLTQLDFCYVFEYVCEKENKNLKLECNAEMDVRGIDAKVNNIGFQIKKITQRKEARRIEEKKNIVTIPYTVFDLEELQRKSESPRVKDKSGYKKTLESFHRYFLYLKNGFIVFKEEYVKQIVGNINSIEKIKKVDKKISLELSGEI
jgi:hypothetical protein